MIYLLYGIHIFGSLALIFIVLIQGGKGAELGAAFGGASQTVFGSRGAATFLGKLTIGFAVLYMLTSLLLSIASVQGTSVIKKTPGIQRSAPVSEGATGEPGAPQQLPVPATGESPIESPVAPAQPDAGK
jgi:preprotein translocase subunit SecG